MTEPVRSTDAPGMMDGFERATAKLAAAMSGKSAPPPDAPAPSPETPPPATPPPPAEPPTPPSPEAAPGEPSPPSAPAEEPPAAPPATPQFQSTAAQRYVEMFGGDVEKALEAALGYNNRLGALGKAHPELFQEGAPGDPNAPPPDAFERFHEPAVEYPSVEEFTPDEQQVLQAVNQWVDQDPRSIHLMRSFAEYDQQLRQKASERDQLQSDVSYLMKKMEDPDLASDDIRKADIKSELRDKRYDLSTLSQEIRAIESDMRDMDNEFKDRRRQFRETVLDRMEQSYAEQSIEREAQSWEQQDYAVAQPAWLSAVNRAITTNQIPQDQAKYFKDVAKVEALAYLGQSDETSIDDFDAFLAPIAKREKERIDAAHRSQAAVYGAQAHARAETPAPPSAPGHEPPPPGQPANLETVMQDRLRLLHDRMRG